MALVARGLNPDRSFALDVCRGLTIASMILVTSPGGPQTYAPLEHAAWNGWTPTDLVFPSFAFIIGVALTYSLAPSRARATWRGRSLFDWITPILAVIQYLVKLFAQTGGFRHAPDPPVGGYDLFFAAVFVLLVVLPQLERRAWQTRSGQALQVIHHGFLIFALGFLWTLDPTNPAGFRVMGVLQRLGIVFVFSGLIVLNTRRRGQIAIVAGLLALYWILMKAVPVPGHGTGVLTMEGNLAGYIDRMILGPAHLYTPRPLPYWDPEGILGAIPAVATVLLGALAGGWMREGQSRGKKMWGLVAVGGLLVLAGLGLDGWFPINKNLWSPTFVLFAGGIDCILLGASIRLGDSGGARKLLFPFVALGANSIFIYLMSGTILRYAGSIPAGTADGVGIGAREAVYRYVFASWLNPYNASLAFALAHVALWIGIAAWLHRRKIFVKL